MWCSRGQKTKLLYMKKGIEMQFSSQVSFIRYLTAWCSWVHITSYHHIKGFVKFLIRIYNYGTEQENHDRMRVQYDITCFSTKPRPYTCAITIVFLYIYLTGMFFFTNEVIYCFHGNV